MATEDNVLHIGYSIVSLDNPFNGLFSGNQTVQTVDLSNYPAHWAYHTFSAAFYNCPNLRSVTGINLDGVTNMQRMFQGDNNLLTITTTGTPTNVNMERTYSGCSLLTTVSIAGANTLYGTCSGCTNLTNITGTINSNCTDMRDAFFECRSLSVIPNIPSSINNISFAFDGCTSLVNPPIFEGTYIGNSTYAFHDCINLISTPDLSKFDNIAGMFSNCTNLSIINGNFNQYITSLSDTFFMCSNITSVPTIPASVNDLSKAFSYCSKLSSYSKAPSNHDISFNETFDNCTSLVSADVTNGIDLKYTFKECTNLINCTGTISPNNEYMNYTFDYCTSLISAPTIPSNSILLEMNATFNHCESLPTVPEIPASVKKLWYTFNYCTALTGNIIIRSEIVEDVTSIFAGTTLTKYVYIPYESWIDDGMGGQTLGPSTTYTTFINAGYDENGTKEGVYLRDLATLQ